MAREDKAQPAIMQRANELARLVAAGKRTDDGSKCSLVLVCRTGGDWMLYPHGVDKFGVRLSSREARRVHLGLVARFEGRYYDGSRRQALPVPPPEHGSP